MSDQSDFVDIDAEMKVFESLLKEDGYILSDEENQLIDKINKNINIKDFTAVLQYGMEAQIQISKFSDSVLEGVKNKTTGEVGDILTDLVAEIKSFDYNISKSNSKFLNLFNGTKKKSMKLISKYNTIENNIDRIEKDLESHRIQMLKDIIVFDEMYKKNLEYLKNISLYITAGEKKIKELNIQLNELKEEKTSQTREQLDVQRVNDMENIINIFEEKIHDLKITKIISIQMASQLRLLQNNESELVRKIQSSLTNTIPLWKNQIILALGIEHSKQALDAQEAVSDATTLNKINHNILENIEQVITIYTNGKQKKLEAEKKLAIIEEDLKKKVSELRG